MKMRPARSLFVATVVSVLAFAAGGTSAAPAAATAGTGSQAPAAQSVATVRPNPRSSVDCNGYSYKYPPVNPGLRMYCADPKALGTGGYGYGGYGHAAAPGRFYDNGHYVGHDEPSVKFESTLSGTGNNMTYFLQLPHDPAGTPTTSPSATPTVSDQSELTPAFWFGLPICDDKSFPSASGVAGDGVGGYHHCTADSDSNRPPGDPSTTGGGSAVMELQFYPPGYGPHFDGISCNATQYCAAVTIDSLEAICGGQPHCTTNPNCAEPVNVALLTFDGVPTGPPSPQLNSYETFSPNADTLLMGQSDALRVSIFDTTHGIETKVDDLTTGRSGFMIASANNGFMQTDPATCNGSPYDFHAEYDTANSANLVPWAALEFGVLISNETGHFEPCSSVSNILNFTATFSPSNDTFADNSAYETCNGAFEAQTSGNPNGEFCDPASGACAGNTQGNIACSPGTTHCEGSDYPCFNAGSRTVTVNGVNQTWSWPVSGCLANGFQNGDLDFDGSSYIADWADGGATHPTTAKFLGPFDASGNEYANTQFETNAPGSEENCNFGIPGTCTVPPSGATFYPYWSIENTSGFPGAPVNTACVWNFGNDGYPAVSDFSKDAQYAAPSSFFPGTLISPQASNPATATSGCLASETEGNVAAALPTVTNVAPTRGIDTSPNTLTVTGTNFTGTFNGSSYSARSVQVGSTQITSTCGAAPCFTVSSATSITVQLPPFPAGVYDVTVTDSGGASLTSSADQYTSAPFNNMFQMDVYGAVSPVPLSPGAAQARLFSSNGARGLALLPGTATGYILDAFGALHSFGGAPTQLSGVPYWFGWDIARGVVLMPDGSGGIVMDGFGGLHGFGIAGNAAPALHGGPYWGGWDIARALVLRPDGTGGYVMDAFGGMHPFGVGNNAVPPQITVGPYWPNWAVARSVAIDGDGLGGYIMDAFGGLHPFGTTNSSAPPVVNDGPYWPGWPIARFVALHPGVVGRGWVLDGFGGIHAWGGAAPLTSPEYTGGAAIAEAIATN